MFDSCLYFNTTALARKLEREWTAAFAPFELTPAQAFMLRAILDRPGMLQRELADTLVIARPTATRTLDGLQAKGLIERHSSGGDGRESAVHATAHAKKMHDALNDASGRVTKRLKAALGEGEFKTTVGKVRSVRAALE
jgi:MarR family transcriptional regulator, temperature-dependent positive regulator of motility